MAQDLNDIRHYAMRLVSRYSARDDMLLEMRRMFKMDWLESPKGDWIRATMSPSSFNQAIGAIRLLTAAEPQLAVPYDEADTTARSVSDKIEAAAKAMWAGAGRVQLRPVHYEVVFSAVLFGEICLYVTKTADLIKQQKRSGNAAGIARAEWIAAETPYLFTVYPPDQCYPDFDHLGLRAMLRRTQTSWGEVVDTWGNMALQAYPGEHEDDEAVTVNDWIDWEYRAVWLEGGGSKYMGALSGGQPTPGNVITNEPILFRPHELGFMPVVAQIAEGSFLFDLPEDQRIPLLYGYWKSGLWKRENLALTVIYSLLFTLGSNPLLKRKTNTPGEPLVINREMPGNVVDVRPDEDIGMLMEKVVDPNLVQGLDLAQRIGAETTITKMALGAPPAHAMAFSSLSMLSQSGRLPLVAPKELGGQAISNALITALRWLKKDGEEQKFYLKRGGVVTLEPDDIPDHIVLECNLEPELPQDKMQRVNVAQAANASGLASLRWGRENILGIGQSGAMDREIFMEKRTQFEIQRLLQLLQFQDQMKMQQQQQAAAAQAQAATQQGQAQAPVQQGGITAPSEAEQAAFAAEQQAAAGPTGALPPGGRVGPGAPLEGPFQPTRSPTTGGLAGGGEGG